MSIDEIARKESPKYRQPWNIHDYDPIKQENPALYMHLTDKAHAREKYGAHTKARRMPYNSTRRYNG